MPYGKLGKAKSKLKRLKRRRDARKRAEGRKKKRQGERSSGGRGGRVLKVRHKDEIDRWTVEGPTAGFGTFPTKQQAISRARNIYNSKEMYEGIAVHNKNGALNTSTSVGQTEANKTTGGRERTAPRESPDGSLNPLFSAGGAGGGADDREPFIPGFDEADDGGGPMLPGISPPPEDDGGAAPFIPGMGGWGMEPEDERDDDLPFFL